ncbi:MAG: PIN domain-containing protein [Propionibacteriaceae bacterium]|nr:PIN domain-containing protein [Propionibacteriaceae bacterium]
MLAGSIDTNVVLRLVMGDVPEHREAALRLISRGRFAVADVAVAEALFVLMRGYGVERGHAIDILLAFADQPNIHVSGIAKRALFNCSLRPKLSFEDSLLLQMALDTDAGPLWTLDRKLANQPEARLLEAEASSDAE